MIYLDNAATSWPKPDCVAQAMSEVLLTAGGNPGRSGHLASLEAGRRVYSTREAIASLCGLTDPLRVVFTQNATEGLNLALRGQLRPGDHVITSSMEHNAVMRPLRYLEEQGVEITVVPCSPQGELNPDDIAPAIKSNTVMIALNHASNVTGTIQPVSEAGRIAREHGLLLLVDAAQSAGLIPLDMERDRIDLLAFTGHKALLGPQGTGGLLIGEEVDLEWLQPLIRGGTGSRSAAEIQPELLPDRYESGTRNAPGLAGLAAALSWLEKKGWDKIRQREANVAQRLHNGLRDIPGVTVYGTQGMDHNTGVVSFNIDNVAPSTVGLELEEEFEILCRVGLHCSPASHRTIGTYPTGTVRLSPGCFTTETEIDSVLTAVDKLATKAAGKIGRASCRERV